MNMKIPSSYTSSGPEDTIKLGKTLASHLKEGSIVALSGPLGSGKTCFARGLIWGLGVSVKEEIKSPTYTIISEYEGRGLAIYHIDAYRLRGGDDFSALGGEEIIYGKGISIIEWGEIIEDYISGDAFRVKIEIKGDKERLINISRGEK